MNDQLNKIITAGVGPIIVISACGLLCLALYNRLAAMVTRLRSFHRERLQAHEAIAKARAAAPPDDRAAVLGQEILGMLELQTRGVLRRARLIRRALICLLLTVACLAVCSLALGLSTMWWPLAYVAVGCFIAGMTSLVAAVGFALAEVARALEPVDLESRFVRDMVEGYEPQIPSPNDQQNPNDQ
jgi:hypothetical protein